MPWNGSGVFSPYTPGNPVVTLTSINSAAFNSTISDLASGLSLAMTKDGQQTPTANLKMGGFKFTALGQGTALADSLNLQQAQDQTWAWLTGIAGTNTITAILAVPTLATLKAGQTFRFIAAAANTGASTLNVNSLGATALRKRMSGGIVELAAADLVPGMPYSCTYDGTQFVLNEQRSSSQGTAIASAATINLDTANGTYAHITGTTAISAITLVQGEFRATVTDGVLQFTNGASLIMPGNANLTSAAGDVQFWIGEAAGMVRCVLYMRAGVAPGLDTGIVATARNIKMSVTTASSTATLTADELVVTTALGGASAKLGAFSQSINLGITGTGGMDTGAAPTNGFVALYASQTGAGATGLFACNAATSAGSVYSGLNPPPGVVKTALVAICPTNGSGQFKPGLLLDRKFNYQTFANIFSGTDRWPQGSGPR